jgi:hypothetical protein
MFDIGIHYGKYKTSRVFHSVPNIGDEIVLCFVEDMELIHTEVVKISHVQIREPEPDGNSSVPFMIILHVEEIAK